MQSLLEGFACFAIGTVVLSLVGTVILGLSCHLSNRIFEIARIPTDADPTDADPTDATSANSEFTDDHIASAETTAATFDTDNPYAVSSVAPNAAVKRSIYPEIPSRIVLFTIELVAFVAYIGLMWLGVVALDNVFRHGNASAYIDLAPVIMLAISWVGTCALKAGLLSRYFVGTTWKILSTIIIDQAIWVITVVGFYIVMFAVVAAFGALIEGDNLSF